MSNAKSQVHEVLKDILSAEKVEFNGTVKTIMITPDMAVGWLEYNDLNRPLARRATEKYKKAMQGGSWKLNGEAILFSDTGRLLDGQHRLKAIIESGEPVPSFVIFGLPEDAFDTMDDGKKRNAAHVLGICGYDHYTCLAAAAKLVAAYGKDTTMKTAGDYDFANQEIHAFVEAHPSPENSVSIAMRNMICANSTIAFCHFLFSQKNLTQANDFIKKLKSGANLPDRDPILVLRNRLLDEKNERAKLPQRDIMALIIKSWNYYRAGKKVAVLRWSINQGEAFPEVK